ncbi:Gfo/Idh/MocA family protein [Reichenbachiella ulvae]|uniref:Gfo/Idh/MocA family oxidoreductase n=1 Tax=Reichenbachiella ulvae TaxID=2980104 RepID=A0ABT3CT45_9BACT|nr:Gfo/Idh/MocA family oxidoreductase [Reichenbachiella ulvae]MCV9386689.1 Gfo/Idh/MocA family oxidoreductase [Reichenbachiella ulvae]
MIKWGIIGVGDVCEKKSAPAMNLIEGSKIQAVMRRNAEKAADYAQRHGIDIWYDDADALIADPEVNAIYIATPPYAHREYTIKAAEAGKPVYVEKPMAKTYSECRDMVEACQKHGVPLFTAYYRRALPNYLKVKELVDSGAIGDVRMVEIRMAKPLVPDIVTLQEQHWRVNPEVAGGGYFHDLASHQLDFLDFLLGPVTKAKGYAQNQAGLYKAEDIVVGSFEFESGVMGTGSWCFSTGQQSDKDITTIIGSKGEISYATFGGSEVTLRTDENNEEIFTFEIPDHIQYPLIQQIVDELLGKGKCVSTGESGARTNKVMEWLTQG